MTNSPGLAHPVDEDLRSWAAGTHPTAAAVELILRAFNGRFSLPGNPWIRDEDGRYWLDVTAIEPNVGALSGGERRLLLIVADLVDGQLGDLVSGLDREALSLVLAAIAHTGGSHEHGDLIIDQENSTYTTTRLGSLYPWPAATA
jgi:hypothetical protein